MPHTITWEASGLYRRYFGDVTYKERRLSLDEIYADPRFDHATYVISDYLDVQHFEQSLEATRELAAFHHGPQLTNSGMVLAAVATRQDIVAELQAFIGLNCISWPYKIFETLGAARDWINGLEASK